jgi:hypothetical protein
MSSYSEFMPGQDFSLRLPSLRGEAGVSTVASIAFRGAAPVPQPILLVTDPSGAESRIQPAAIQDPTGRPSWRASFTPETSGNWQLKIVDPRPTAPPEPELLFTVPTSPGEMDDLSPDPGFLSTISRATGGKSITPNEFPEFLKTILTKSNPLSQESGAVWKPYWNQALIAIIIAVILGFEWFIRRRTGLT